LAGGGGVNLVAALAAKKKPIAKELNVTQLSPVMKWKQRSRVEIPAAETQAINLRYPNII
jgi:hypothetical protein